MTVRDTFLFLALSGCARCDRSENAEPSPPPSTSGSSCNRPDPLGPVLMPTADAQRSPATTILPNLNSSKESPVELCGVEAELNWLVTLRCLNGSVPLRTVRDASAARSRSIRAGRCDSMVDLFDVNCPERTYVVFVDAYVCASINDFK